MAFEPAKTITRSPACRRNKSSSTRSFSAARSSIGSLRCRGQPQAQRRSAEQGRLAIAAAGEMMRFVEDDQAETIAHLRHARVGAVIGGDGNGLKVEERVANDAGVVTECAENA